MTSLLNNSRMYLSQTFPFHDMPHFQFEMPGYARFVHPQPTPAGCSLRIKTADELILRPSMTSFLHARGATTYAPARFKHIVQTTT
ncbi:unnamed protein product [Rhizoctonia solani]|uniref:Uncharacterized protein n=1 Tax=Rhizoctonia solani TaxID=456999 RepID=A0A8H3HAP3_9AGAM|nr:unnamed protein product [Rhizoctonia solani]